MTHAKEARSDDALLVAIGCAARRPALRGDADGGGSDASHPYGGDSGGGGVNDASQGGGNDATTGTDACERRRRLQRRDVVATTEECCLRGPDRDLRSHPAPAKRDGSRAPAPPSAPSGSVLRVPRHEGVLLRRFSAPGGVQLCDKDSDCTWDDLPEHPIGVSVCGGLGGLGGDGGGFPGFDGGIPGMDGCGFPFRRVVRRRLTEAAATARRVRARPRLPCR